MGEKFQNQTGTTLVLANKIDTYQKNGLYVDGPGTLGYVLGNEISGDGPNTSIAQNGIQMSRGAGGVVYANQVSDNVYTGSAEPGQASGIILFRVPSDTRFSNLAVANSTIRGNDDNLPLINNDGITVTNNTSNDAVFYDGLFADADSSGNRFEGNKANNEHDCHDDSTGSATAGTAPLCAGTGLSGPGQR